MSKNPLNNQMMIAVVVTAVIVGPLAFFGGMKYDAGKAGAKVTAGGNNFQRGAMMNGAVGGNGQFGGQRGAGGTGTGTTGTRIMRGGSTVGEVLSVDETGLTVKVNGGGSRRVLLPEKVTVSSCAEGDKTAVAVGKFVIVTGDPNTDNSITARNIQVMPTMPTTMPFGGRSGQGGTEGGAGTTPPPGL